MAEVEVSMREKRTFICASAAKLLDEDTKEVAKLIKRLGLGDKLCYSADGARINLEPIADNIINILYTQIQHKVSKNANIPRQARITP